MADHQEQSTNTMDTSNSGNSAVAVKSRPQRPKVDRLPPWRVLLHNDEINDMGYVVATVMQLARLNEHMAIVCMMEAHKTGISLLLTTHREHAELLHEQFASKQLKVTIEPER